MDSGKKNCREDSRSTQKALKGFRGQPLPSARWRHVCYGAGGQDEDMCLFDRGRELKTEIWNKMMSDRKKEDY